LGGSGIDMNLTNLFNTTLNQCDLNDLGFYGYKYTWANNQSNQAHIQEHLDRFCANSNWIANFPRYTNKHLLRYTFDHALIMLDFYDYEASKTNFQPKRLKRFEHIWTEDQECNKIITDNWISAQNNIQDKLSSVLDQLDRWGRLKFGDLSKKIKITQDALNVLKNQIPNEEGIQKIKEEEKVLDELLSKEEIWWSQRAKVHWLKFGDLNNKYFHHKARQRRRKNSIYSIADNNGNIWRDDQHIHHIFTNHFQGIFTSTKPIINPEDLKVVKNKIDPNMFSYLAADYTSEEVRTAVHQLRGTSAPGPDGIPALFFHKYWDIIGNDILNYTLMVLNHDLKPDQINYTFISLIPKVSNPTTPSDFRPISLCNVVIP
jgi:hypothetical protein